MHIEPPVTMTKKIARIWSSIAFKVKLPLRLYGVVTMNIGEMSTLTGLSSKSIRLYEEKGIISAPHRSDSGYREYSSQHLQELNLVSRAKNAGFSLIECKEFVQLAHNPERKSSEVKARAQEKLDEVQLKIKQLQEIERQLQQWVSSCPGDGNSKCPIMDDLTKQ